MNVQGTSEGGTRLQGDSTCVLCRQPLGGATFLEVFLPSDHDAAPWEAAMGAQIKVGETSLTLRDVAHGNGPDQAGAVPVDGFWLRGDALQEGGYMHLQSVSTNTLLVYQRLEDEPITTFCSRVFEKNLALNAGSRFETPYSLGPGGSLLRMPGTSLKQLLDDLFAQLATGHQGRCWWTAGPWQHYLRGVWKAELHGNYVAGALDLWNTLRTPMGQLDPLIPRHEWQVVHSQGIAVDQNFRIPEAAQLLQRYIECSDAQHEHQGNGITTVARLPGEWTDARGRSLPVVETVLLLHCGRAGGAWVPSHHLLSGTFPRHHPPRLLRPLRAHFMGWGRPCPAGGTLAQFRPFRPAGEELSWAVGKRGRADENEALFATIHTPGMEAPEGDKKPLGLYLSPRQDDLFDLEVPPATWPYAMGGRMTAVEAWPAGVAVLNAPSIALATEPDATNATAELAITADQVSMATQVTITKEASTFKKMVKIQSSLQVDS